MHGQVAGAFINTNRDLFQNLTNGIVPSLSAAQVQLGHHNGFVAELTSEDDSFSMRLPASSMSDIHTAVKCYLKWRAQHYDASTMTLLRRGCLEHMHDELLKSAAVEWRGGLSLDNCAEALLLQSGWEKAITLDLAFAYQKNIVHAYADKYTGGLPTIADAAANDAANAPQRDLVTVSARSLCNSAHSSGAPPQWLVYAGRGRVPQVTSATPLPGNIAAWFSTLTVSWEPGPHDSGCNFGASFLKVLGASSCPTRMAHVADALGVGCLPLECESAGTGNLVTEVAHADEDSDHEVRAASRGSEAAVDAEAALRASAETASFSRDFATVAQEMLTSLTFEDHDDFEHALRALQQRSPKFTAEVETFVRRMRKQDEFGTRDALKQSQKCITRMLRLLLPKEQISTKQIRRYCYSAFTAAVRAMQCGERPYGIFAPEMQADILEACPACCASGACHACPAPRACRACRACRLFLLAVLAPSVCLLCLP
jgi:hypothetical protein